MWLTFPLHYAGLKTLLLPPTFAFACELEATLVDLSRSIVQAVLVGDNHLYVDDFPVRAIDQLLQDARRTGTCCCEDGGHLTSREFGQLDHELKAQTPSPTCHEI